MAQHITATVATRGRYDTTLPQTLVAIASQTRPPDELWIVDDNPPEQRQNLLEHPVIAPILGILNTVTKTLIVEGKRMGPHVNHEVARLQAKDLIWRVDDDEIPEPEVLQVLEGHLLADPRVGAAAGLVPVPPQVSTNDKASCEIEDFFDCKNVQWYNWPEGKIFSGAGHLHSTYLYRKNAATYRTDLSPVGHCEETFHTMEIVRNGFILVIDTNVRTWHCRCQTGGIRTHTNVAHYESDWQKFEAWAKTLPFKFRRTCNVIAMHGQGDVFAALTASNHIIDFQRKHGNRVRFICRKNDVPLFSKFIDDDVSVCTPEVAAQYELRHNGEIYGWMLRDKFTGGLVNAFKHYYTEGYPTWLGY